MLTLQFSKLVKLKKDQANLPISHFKEQIVDAVGSHQVVIIAGDTGCGKSTQVQLAFVTINANSFQLFHSIAFQLE